MEEITKIDLTKSRIEEIKPSISKQEFIEAYNNNTEIIGFIGAVKITNQKLNSMVPKNFINSCKPVMIQEEYEDFIINDNNENEIIIKTRLIPKIINDEVVTEQKTWSEYSIYQKSINNNILLSIGSRDSNGNRHAALKNDELRQWVNYFGISNVLTKSDYHKQIKIEEVTE